MAEEPLSVSLRDLRILSTHLNEITDKAIQTVQEVEQFLNDCNIGISVSVPTRVTEINGGVERGDRYLAYEPVGRNRQFRFVVHDKFGPDKAWAECSREIKIESIAVLPKLIEALSSKITEKIRETDQSLEQVAQLLSHVRKGEQS